MKKILSLLMLIFMAAGAQSMAWSACNREIGACRISDLQKPLKTSQVKVTDENKVTSQKDIPKVKVKEKKPTFKQFIVSLLKP